MSINDLHGDGLYLSTRTPFWRVGPLPKGWRKAQGIADAQFACSLVEQNMQSYWSRRRMRFNAHMFMHQWNRLDALLFTPQQSRAGLIAWDIDPDFTYAHLRELHVQSDHQHQGHGRHILSAWIEQCRHFNVKGMRLKVFSENPAMALYTQMGFVPMSEDSEVNGLIDMHHIF